MRDDERGAIADVLREKANGGALTADSGELRRKLWTIDPPARGGIDETLEWLARSNRVHFLEIDGKRHFIFTEGARRAPGPKDDGARIRHGDDVFQLLVRRDTANELLLLVRIGVVIELLMFLLLIRAWAIWFLVDSG